MKNEFLILKNGVSAQWQDLPAVPMAQFRETVLSAIAAENLRVGALFVMEENGSSARLIAVLGDPAAHEFRLIGGLLDGKKYPSLTADCPAFHWFEREIYEQTGIVPEGHPWLKPIRFENGDQPGVTEYFPLQGDAAHEVAVGPVHAGVIEPGHFRFQCLGEEVEFLEIELGYQHRGLDQLLSNGPETRTAHWVETAAGDSSIAAATVYGTLMRSLAQDLPQEPQEGVLWRAVMLELERIANHVGDLGALAGDVAFLPTASYCGRIRGDYLNLTASWCGNRFGRALWTPRGAALAIPASAAATVRSRIDELEKQLNNALDLLFDAPSVLDRFENTGSVSLEDAAALGLVGVAARACGCKMDARRDFPLPETDLLTEIPVGTKGDVFDRAETRRKEIAISHKRIRMLLEKIRQDLPAAGDSWKVPALLPQRIGVAVTEGWRGELWHIAVTGDDGKFRRYKVVDPSFHNWAGLAMALRGAQISDFPICNKSFNLSYCGHDL